MNCHVLAAKEVEVLVGSRQKIDASQCPKPYSIALLYVDGVTCQLLRGDHGHEVLIILDLRRYLVEIGYPRRVKDFKAYMKGCYMD